MATATATTGGGYAAGEQVPDDIFTALNSGTSQPSPANTGAVPINPTDTQVAARKAATEPAVVTSDTIANHVIPDNKTKLDAVSQKGTYVGQDGNTYYSDGSVVPAPVNAEFDGTSWTSGGQKFASGPQYVNNPNNDPEIDNTNRILSSLKAGSDSSTVSTINAIQSQFDALIQNQQAANARAGSARQQSLLEAGTSRYAPLAAAGVTLAQTSYGLQQIQNLEAQENTAIAQAKQAQQSNNMALMDKALATIDSVRTQKQAAAQKVADQLATANDALQKQQLQASRDQSIASLVSQGVTDPATVLSTLNAAGGNFTLAEINTAMKALQPTSSATDVYKFSTTDVGKLLGAGLHAGDIQKLSDYYNGKSNVAPPLTTEQQRLVNTLLNGSAVAGGNKSYTSGTYTYTQTDLNKGQAWLDATRGDDHHADPNAYLQLAQGWTESGGNIKDFLAKYPMSSYINPANTFVKPAIDALLKQDKGPSSAAAADTITPAQIDALFSQSTPTQ